eukprot:TRINITY_DN6544_c0_g1_i2.p1 TRINITY_DN6544_c0_g1~~TRINITY_DN6544_c0_g1_i2.p1  ORF type:complete len:238 (-),score=-7.18 TRINITY_DN6544_c0_g1_i2:96-809(-)
MQSDHAQVKKIDKYLSPIEMEKKIIKCVRKLKIINLKEKSRGIVKNTKKKKNYVTTYNSSCKQLLHTLFPQFKLSNITIYNHQLKVSIQYQLGTKKKLLTTQIQHIKRRIKKYNTYVIGFFRNIKNSLVTCIAQKILIWKQFGAFNIKTIDPILINTKNTKTQLPDASIFLFGMRNAGILQNFSIVLRFHQKKEHNLYIILVKMNPTYLNITQKITHTYIYIYILVVYILYIWHIFC